MYSSSYSYSIQKQPETEAKLHDLRQNKSEKGQGCIWREKHKAEKGQCPTRQRQNKEEKNRYHWGMEMGQ